MCHLLQAMINTLSESKVLRTATELDGDGHCRVVWQIA
jgi:predicted ArsR family transcriptional regulator